jgi:hypothetical protein
MAAFSSDPDPSIVSSRILIQTFFILNPGSYMKSGMQNYWYFFLVFLLFQEQSLKDPGSEIQDPEKIHPVSGSLIQWVKKQQIPDQQH